MKPLSGMWLYINLAFAIVWDVIGFTLFIVGLIPAVQAVAIAASPVIDVIAFLTDLIFCILYQGYVKIYNVNFKLYQVKRIKEVMLLSKKSGASANNPIAQKLLRQTQKINQYMIDKFSNYVIDFTVKKIQYSIFTSVVELVPWLGDFSPTWTIKANLHLREHKATAREMKIKNIEFENSLAKWRGAIKRPLSPANNIVRSSRLSQRQSTNININPANNIKKFARTTQNQLPDERILIQK
jgi:hypothetical protein